MIDDRVRQFMGHIMNEANNLMTIIGPICEKADQNLDTPVPQEDILKMEYARGRMECLRDMARKLSDIYGPDAELKRLAALN